MDDYRWNEDKNKWLKQTRGISFEDVIQAIENGQMLSIMESSNLEKYPNQSIMVIRIKNYVYCVPYVKDESVIFFKTIFPSRKMKQKFLGG